MLGTGPQAHADLAVKSELECIGDQVEDDLFPHVGVNEDRLGQRWAIDFQRHPSALEGRAEHACEVRGQRGEIRGLIGCLDATGLDAGELQQRVDELQ